MADNKNDSVTIETVTGGGGEVGGELRMSQEVVATIASISAKQVKGIHALGKSKLIGTSKGVEAEVGVRQAALDLDVVIDFGVDVRKVAAELRKVIATNVDRMAGREVVEVNINVVGIHLDEEKDEPEAASRRVE